jgi:hypothetical protein
MAQTHDYKSKRFFCFDIWCIPRITYRHSHLQTGFEEVSAARWRHQWNLTSPSVRQLNVFPLVSDPIDIYGTSLTVCELYRCEITPEVVSAAR